MVSSLSPEGRTAARVIGIVLLLAGAVCLLMSVTAMNNGPSIYEPGPQFEQDSKAAFGQSATLGILGILCLVAGSIVTRIGFLGAAAGIVATETAPAVQYGVAAAARGLGQGLAEAGVLGAGGATQVVRVKCRSCGFLDTEDATFCSKCGKPI